MRRGATVGAACPEPDDRGATLTATATGPVSGVTSPPACAIHAVFLALDPVAFWAPASLVILGAILVTALAQLACVHA